MRWRCASIAGLLKVGRCDLLAKICAAEHGMFVCSIDRSIVSIFEVRWRLYYWSQRNTHLFVCDERQPRVREVEPRWNLPIGDDEHVSRPRCEALDRTQRVAHLFVIWWCQCAGGVRVINNCSDRTRTRSRSRSRTSDMTYLRSDSRLRRCCHHSLRAMLHCTLYVVPAPRKLVSHSNRARTAASHRRD